MPFKFEKPDLWKQPLDYANAAYEIADRSTGQSDKEQRRFPGIQLTGQGEGPNEKGLMDTIDQEKLESSTSQHLNSSTLSESEDLIEVNILLYDPSRGNEKLGWDLEFQIDELVKDMVEVNLRNISKLKSVSSE